MHFRQVPYVIQISNKSLYGYEECITGELIAVNIDHFKLELLRKIKYILIDILNYIDKLIITDSMINWDLVSSSFDNPNDDLIIIKYFYVGQWHLFDIFGEPNRRLFDQIILM